MVQANCVHSTKEPMSALFGIFQIEDDERRSVNFLLSDALSVETLTGIRHREREKFFAWEAASSRRMNRIIDLIRDTPALTQADLLSKIVVARALISPNDEDCRCRFATSIFRDVESLFRVGRD